MAIDLQKSISQITTQLQPMLDAFLKALGIRTGREEKRTLQKAQQMGRVTTGFLPEMQREVREEAGMEEAQYRGTHAQNIANLAMQLFGVESEGERQQAQLQSAERMAELSRQLTREGWSAQAIQAEMDRQLTREGWDWQSKENILDRALKGRGDIITPEYKPGPWIPPKLPSADIPYEKYGRVGIYQPIKPAPVKAPVKAPAPTYQAPKTTYRGTRGGIFE